MLRVLAALLAFATLALGGYALRDRLPWAGPEAAPVAAPSNKPPKAVATAVVAPTVVVDRIDAIGTVKARHEVALTVEAAGIVEEILFDSGAVVEKGALLLRLDDGSERAQLAAAQAALENARRSFARASELRRAGTVSQQVLDEAQAALEAARADLAVAEARLAERRVHAPFGGRVGFREVSPGAYVTPGDRLATLDDLASVYVDFKLPEHQLSALAIDQAVGIRSVAHPGAVFGGRVAAIDTRIDPGSRQAQVRAVVDNRDGRLRPGQLVEVEVAVRERPALVVPDTAVVSIGHQGFAFVVAGESTVQRRAVALGKRMDGRVEVTEGLSPGDILVVEGASKLEGGDRVTVVPAVALTPAARAGS